MKILARYKDKNDNTCGYLLENKGNRIKLGVKSTRDLVREGLITGVTLLKNGEIRGNRGYRIDTINNNSKLEKLGSTLPVIKGKSLTGDVVESFYGEGYIDICRKIRHCAWKNKIDFRCIRDKHYSNKKNTHMFKLIESCGISVERFLRGYLSVLQPYSLSKFQGKRVKRDNIDGIWLCDIGYGVQLVIKVIEKLNTDMLIVSFHESFNSRGIVAGNKSFNNGLCAVFVDQFQEGRNGLYKVKSTIQRGFLRTEIESETIYFNGSVALIEYGEIRSKFNKLIGAMMSRVIDLYKPDDLSIFEYNTDKLDISRLRFMSSGYNIENKICLLIDIFNDIEKLSSRSLTRGNILSIVDNMFSEMTDERILQIKEALVEHFSIVNEPSNVLLEAIKEIKV